jgi:N-acetyl-anhydromuramoyl-L-alanine amidase
VNQGIDAWEDGWYRAAQREPSPNFGARPAGAAVDLLVVHSISLPPGVFGTGRVRDLFLNQLDTGAHPYFAQLQGVEVSAHFLIERNGRLWQFVDCDCRAWHAGASNYRGRANCNDDSIGVELEGLEGGHFEAAQYQCLLSLTHAIRARYALQYVAGHEHIAPERKADPGPGFDWIALQKSPAFDGLQFPHQTILR